MTPKSSGTTPPRTKPIATPSGKSVASPVSKSTTPPSPPVSPAGSYVSQGHGVPPNSVAVSLSLKRFKLASLAVVIVSAIVVFMVFFQRGVTLKEVDLIASEANEVSQKKLLDDYNSYTGIASSAITKPIEMFTTMAVQLTLLRFVAKSLLVPQLAWRVDKTMAAAAFALVFLVLNGFSALNVQLEPRGIKAVVSLSDLVLEGTGNATTTNSSSQPLAIMDTSFSNIVPETTAGNLITNTVLRTAVVPRVWQMPDTTCSRITNYQLPVGCTDVGIEFGFTTRPWMAKMLPAAPATKMLTISLLNGTTAAAPQAVQLPMSASLAADLLMDGVEQANLMADWFTNNYFPVAARVNASVTKAKPLRMLSARASGLLPFSDTGDETKEREWLLKEAPRLLQTKFAEAKETNRETGMSVSFSHVDLTDRITFDAVTLEAAVNAENYTTAVDAQDKTTQYFAMGAADASCGPKPLSLCGVEKFSRSDDGSSSYYDLPSTIVVGTVCVNADGTETYMDTVARSSMFDNLVSGTTECNVTSNSTMLVVSIAKRIVGDSVLEQANARTANISGLTYPVLVNARKIFSITVGRLSWQTQDIATTFGATCDVTTGTKCHGLQFPLSTVAAGNTTTTSSSSRSSGNESEVLVAGVAALPVAALGSIRGMRSENKYTPLVRIREPLKFREDRSEQTSGYDAVAGDLLLPHNLLVNRTRNISTNSCEPRMDQRLHITLTNHLYMEHGLQPAYTAAMFYLFQNGVVKKSVNMVASKKNNSSTSSTGTSAKTLSFDKNTQTSALVASIPALNVYQSLVGCALLAIGVLATVFHSGSLLSSVGDSDDSANNTNTNTNNSKNANTNNNPQLAQISDPRVVAQVMLDEGRFPPMFLERTLIHTSGGLTTAGMATFAISSMTLNTDGDDSKCVVLDKKATGPSSGVV